MKIAEMVEQLKHDLLRGNASSVTMIMAARFCNSRAPESPAWLEALANGNLDQPDEVVLAARAFALAEDNDSNGLI